jgi:hypothetical protein
MWAGFFFLIVVYLLRARTVEPQKQPFLSNTRTNNGTPASSQQVGKHISSQAQ